MEQFSCTCRGQGFCKETCGGWEALGVEKPRVYLIYLLCLCPHTLAGAGVTLGGV